MRLQSVFEAFLLDFGVKLGVNRCLKFAYFGWKCISFPQINPAIKLLILQAYLQGPFADEGP